jgi:ribonucleoside-triphosphate reductase
MSLKEKIEKMYCGDLGRVATENANKNSNIIPVQRDLLAGIVSREFALDEILPEYIAEAHRSGDIHFHDLDYSPFSSAFNCILIDVGGMLETGFKMGNAEIETPKSITTATTIVSQIQAQVACHVYGGNTVDRIDEVLAPYVRASYNKHYTFMLNVLKGDKEKAGITAHMMTEKECYDAFQTLEYQINTMQTSNG